MHSMSSLQPALQTAQVCPRVQHRPELTAPKPCTLSAAPALMCTKFMLQPEGCPKYCVQVRPCCCPLTGTCARRPAGGSSSSSSCPTSWRTPSTCRCSRTLHRWQALASGAPSSYAARCWPRPSHTGCSASRADTEACVRMPCASHWAKQASARILELRSSCNKRLHSDPDAVCAQAVHDAAWTSAGQARPMAAPEPAWGAAVPSRPPQTPSEAAWAPASAGLPLLGSKGPPLFQARR